MINTNVAIKNDKRDNKSCYLLSTILEKYAKRMHGNLKQLLMGIRSEVYKSNIYLSKLNRKKTIKIKIERHINIKEVA